MSGSISNLEPGTTLGDYRIDGVAGQGGMGVVYRATQLGLGRAVALKVIAAEYADNVDFRNRFKAEAQVAASVDHPNVVPIFEAGEVDGVLYLAMRYVEGTDLRTLVASSQRLDPERAVRIVWQVAGALDAAHRRGLVHRDVKPPNVLIAREGEEHAYLTDFGLTKLAAASGGFTRTGNFIGTPDFAAPEQIRGEHADARADVYALGAVLFHALTGRVPFPRDSELAKMYAHLNDPAPAASPLAAGIPPALDVVIGTAMAKAPDDRFASGGDLARAALAALQGEVAPAPVGSVATGEALEQPSRVPDTPAPRAPSVATAFPGAAAPTPASAPAAPTPTPAPVPAPQAPTPAPPSAAAEPAKAAGPAGWPRRRRVALLLALPFLLVLAAAAAALGAAGVFDGPRDPRAATPTPTATASATARLQSEPTLQRTATIQIGADAQGISLGAQLAWVANTGDDTVQRIDRAQAQTVGDPIGVGDHPIGIHVGSEAWVTNFRDGTLSRIDIATAQVEGAPIPTGRGARGVTEGFGAVWVSNLHDDTVARVSTKTLEVEALIKVGQEPKELVAALGSVWVVNSGSNTVTRIDPRTNRVAGSSISVGRNPIGITATRGAVWVTNFADDTVSAIKP